MVYQPTSELGKQIKEIWDTLSGVQHEWNTYATQLGIGYREAYKEHVSALKDVGEQYRLAAESQYWLLSLLCVAAAGGVAGGLMAPWVSKQGISTAKQIRRTFVSEATQSIAGSLVQKGIGSPNLDEAPFKPAVKDPLQYWQDMLGEIGVCFSQLRQDVEQFMIDTDRKQDRSDPHKRTGATLEAIRQLTQHPLIRDVPRQMPDAKKVQREAEFGMWLAWANVRPHDYWKKRYDALSDGVDNNSTEGNYMIEMRRLNRIVGRLKELGYEDLGTTVVSKNTMISSGRLKEKILDINKLRNAGLYFSVIPSDVFFSKVATVVKEPHKVLSSLQALPPVYKRT